MRLLEPIEEIILFAEPNQKSNVYGEARIWASGFNCRLVAITKHETEVDETLKMGIPFFQPLPVNWGRFGMRGNRQNQPERVVSLYLRGKGQPADTGQSYYCSAWQQQTGGKSRYHAVIVDRPKAITCNAVPVYC